MYDNPLAEVVNLKHVPHSFICSNLIAEQCHDLPFGS